MTEFFLMKMSVIVFSILGAALVISTLKLFKELYAKMKIMHGVNSRAHRAMAKI